MGDEALRRAAREAAVGLGSGELTQLLRQRVRNGDVREADLRRAASLGYAPAALALGLEPPEGDLGERSEAFLGTCKLQDSVRVALAAARAAAPACSPQAAAPIRSLLNAIQLLLIDLDHGESQDAVDDQLERLNPRTPLIMGQPTYPPDAPPDHWAQQAAFEAGRTTQHPQLFRVHAHCAVVFAARAVGDPPVRQALEAAFLAELIGGAV